MSTTEGLAVQFEKSCSDLNINLSNSQQAGLFSYLSLLAKWNRAYNLTSIPNSQWQTELLLDALVALPYIDKSPVLDVGSGAGLPGIPLAIARPDLEFTLLDSNGKKTRFIKQIAIDLPLPNLNVIQSRIEDFTAASGYALIVSRAYAELDVFINSTQHLLAKQGRWLAWKGAKLQLELEKVSMPVVINQTIEVKLPGVAGPRYLLDISKT